MKHVTHDFETSVSDQGPLALNCWHGNKRSGSVKGGEYFLLAQRIFRFRRTVLHGVSE
jgi:hypothetical protein